MQFDVNEHSYLLTFNPNEGRWYVFASSFGHLQSVRVINDDDATVSVGVTVDGEGQAIIN